MTVEELRKFDKETFVQYFAQNLFSDYTRTDLDIIQHRLRFDALYKRISELLEEMKKMGVLKTEKDFSKYRELWSDYTKVQRKIDKLLGIPKSEAL